MRITTRLFLVAALVAAPAGAKVFEIAPVAGYESVPEKPVYGGVMSIRLLDFVLTVRASSVKKGISDINGWKYRNDKYYGGGGTVSYLFRPFGKKRAVIVAGLDYYVSREVVDKVKFYRPRENYLKLEHRFLFIGGFQTGAEVNGNGLLSLIQGGAGITIIRQKGYYYGPSEGSYSDEPLNDTETALSFAIRSELKQRIAPFVAIESIGEATVKFGISSDTVIRNAKSTEFCVYIGPMFFI